MIDLQDIITTKRELLSRATYSRNPINYSAGMAEDQKDRYIQYLAEQNQDLRLTGDAMKLVLEDFMAQMKELKDQMSSMQSKHVDLENRLSEEHKLRKSAERKIKSLQENKFNQVVKVSLDNLFSQIDEGNMKELDVIIKADVQGSVEAVKQSLEKLSNDEVRVRAIHGGVGAINESDVMLANASNAIIVGFNVRPDAGALASAEQNEVDIRLYRVIYQAIEEIEAAMKGMLDPEFKEVVIGYAEVRQTFKVSNVGTIAGCYVTQGKIQRNAEIRIVRNGIIVHEGTINSLKRFKDDAKEVAENFECGIGVENFNDIKEGDTIECFVMEEIER